MGKEEEKGGEAEKGEKIRLAAEREGEKRMVFHWRLAAEAKKKRK